MTTVDATGAIHGTDGRFAGHIAAEADSSVALAPDPGGISRDEQVLEQRCREAQQRLRDARMDPATGWTQPQLAGSVDLANTPVADWPATTKAGVGNLGMGAGITTIRPASQEMRRQVEAHEAAGGRVESWTDDRGRHVVMWTRHGKPWRDTSQCKQMGVPVEYADGTPTVLLTPDGRCVTSDVSRGGIFERRDSDGTTHKFAPATGTQWSTDSNGQGHRTDGPAYIGERGVNCLRHGVIDREPDEGPAMIDMDGQVSYVRFGATAQLTEDQMARHNVVRATDGTLRLNGFHADRGDRLLDWYNRGFIV